MFTRSYVINIVRHCNSIFVSCKLFSFVRVFLWITWSEFPLNKFFIHFSQIIAFDSKFLTTLSYFTSHCSCDLWGRPMPVRPSVVIGILTEERDVMLKEFWQKCALLSSFAWQFGMNIAVTDKKDHACPSLTLWF